MSTKGDHKVRFDTRSPTFEVVAGAYRLALDQAERLRQRLLRAEKAGALTSVERLERKLVAAEAEIDQASAALRAHTRATAVASMTSRRRPGRRATFAA